MIISKNTPAFTAKFNELYGHASVLRKYMKVYDEDLVICGHLQHGWSIGARSVDPSPLPLYVWNERSYAGVQERGQDAHLIGAPFIYGAFDTEPKMATSSLLAFPDHSTVGCRYESRYEAAMAYAEWLNEIRKREGFIQVTVALHFNDYFDYTTTSVFNRYGIATVTCGAPLGSSDYLQRVVDLMKDHSVVTSNVIGTAIFYACLLKKLVFVDGPIPVRTGLNGSTELISSEALDREWQRSNFPKLCCDIQNVDVQYDVGVRELGLLHKKSPSELWDIVQMCYMRPA